MTSACEVLPSPGLCDVLPHIYRAAEDHRLFRRSFCVCVEALRHDPTWTVTGMAESELPKLWNPLMPSPATVKLEQSVIDAR